MSLVPIWYHIHLTATECHLPYGITQCYLPPDTSEHTPARQAGTRFTDHLKPVCVTDRNHSAADIGDIF